MLDILKLIIPLFSPKNYTEILKKVAAFAFWEVWILTFLLRTIPLVEHAFSSIEKLPPIRAIISIIPHHQNLNLVGFVIALIVAGFSYMIQIHDRISDRFSIRVRFDRNNILLPLATLVGAQLTQAKLNSLIQNHDPLMREVFYKYASSRDEHPLVDKHDIERALDAWSWYWIFIEALAFLLVAGIIATALDAYSMAVGILFAFIVVWLFMHKFYSKLERLVRPEIGAIAADAKAKIAVRAAFDAL